MKVCNLFKSIIIITILLMHIGHTTGTTRFLRRPNKSVKNFEDKICVFMVILYKIYVS